MHFVDNSPRKVLSAVLEIKPKRFKKHKLRQNCGSPSRYPDVNLDHAVLSHREKHLMHLIQDLGWSYEGIAESIGCSKQAVYLQAKKIRDKVGLFYDDSNLAS